MLTKNEIKGIQSLYHKKHREAAGLFIAEGSKLATEILRSDYEITNLYATAKWLHENESHCAAAIEISEAELQKISILQTPRDVVIIVKQKTCIELPSLKNKLTLVLDGIQDPGNMGTIIRTADWFGLSQIVCSHDCADLYNPKVVQATMGSIVRINCCYVDTAEWKIESGIAVYGALLNGQNIYETKPVNEGLLIIGSEGKGIREPLLSKVSSPVTIPKLGQAESLNAAVAAGIIIGWMRR